MTVVILLIAKCAFSQPVPDGKYKAEIEEFNHTTGDSKTHLLPKIKVKNNRVIALYLDKETIKLKNTDHFVFYGGVFPEYADFRPNEYETKINTTTSKGISKEYVVILKSNKVH